MQATLDDVANIQMELLIDELVVHADRRLVRSVVVRTKRARPQWH
jgi:hypothetical protein